MKLIASWMLLGCAIFLSGESDAGIQATNLGPSSCRTSRPCQNGQGDCDDDSECAGSLVCFQRDNNEAKIGYDFTGMPAYYDFCVHPGNCVDTDKGKTDSYGDGCAHYKSYHCGKYDANGFVSNEMCCACGGGTTAEIGCSVVKLLVKAEHHERAIKRASRYSKTIESASSFEENYKRLSVAASVEASYGLFSGSASVAYDSVTSAASRYEGYKETESSDAEDFLPGFLQIIRKVTTTVTVNGRAAQTVSTDYVDSVSKDTPESRAELKKRSSRYMNEEFGHLTNGKIVGSNQDIYEENHCITRG